MLGYRKKFRKTEFSNDWCSECAISTGKQRDAIRDGIVVIPEDTVIPDGTTI